ncbi:uncharacterized protein LOC125656187 [Ostrea edulis]|uniref:uncharacterized protein LOC125656187 n=1 Tax=Ostrea edulis TaxID=37623 RepID=UPI0024AFB1E1|nr:uncharacterized protein LOC125656187 [Ostrea edulis]
MKAFLLVLLQCVCYGYSPVSTMHIQEEICRSGTASLKIQVVREKMSRESMFIPQLVVDPIHTPFRKKRNILPPRSPILASCAFGNKYVVKILEVLSNGANIGIPDDRIISVFHTNSMLKLSTEYFVTVSPYKNCAELKVMTAREWDTLNMIQKNWLENDTYKNNCGEMEQCFGNIDSTTFRCYDKFSYCATIKGQRRLKKKSRRFAFCVKRWTREGPSRHRRQIDANKGLMLFLC